MRVRSAAWRLALLLAGSAVPAVGQAPAGLHDLAWRHFDARDGLTPISAYVLHRTGGGDLLVGTDEGLWEFDGLRWSRLPLPLPGDGRDAVVRALLETPDGCLWVATRSHGVLRRCAAGWVRFGTAEGLPSEAVYALVRTSVFGTPTVAAGTLRGLARAEGDRFVAVAGPDGWLANALMLAETHDTAGVATLWVGSSSSGLASLRNGRWRVWGRADGLPERSIEQVVPGLPGSGVEVYAVGDLGAFEHTATGWRRIAGSPREAYRLLAVPDGRGVELWIGNRSGALWRRAVDGGWTALHELEPRLGAPVATLAGLPAAAGGPSVLVGFVGSRLARATRTGAGRLMLPERQPVGIRAFAAVATGSAGEVVYAAAASGQLLRIDGDHITALPSPRLDGRMVSLTAVVPGDDGAPRWVASSNGVWRRDGTAWRRVADDSAYVDQLVRTTLLDGASRLVAGTSRGLRVLADDGRWAAVPGTPRQAVTLLRELPSGPGGRRELWVGYAGELWRRTGSRWVVSDRTTGLPPADLFDLAVVQAAGGRRVMLAAAAGAGLAIAPAETPEAAWQRLDILRGLPRPLTEVHGVAAAPDGRVLVGTRGGVVVLSGPARAPAWELLDVYGSADGLPGDAVWQVHVVAGGERALVAASQGVGVLDLAAPPRPATEAPLRLTLRTAAGVRLGAGATVDPDDGVVVAVALDAQHREDEIRYRIELAELGGEAPWSAEPEVAFRRLPTGPLTVRVWARDWRGQVAGPVERRLEVDGSPWQRPGVVVGAVLLPGLAVWGVARARERQLARRAEELEAAARRIRESEEKFRALFDGARDAHVLVEHGSVIACNPVARDLLGLAQEVRPVAADTPLVGLLHGPLARAEDEPITGAFDWWLDRADGRSVPLEVTCSTIVLEGRTIEHLILRDISVEYEADRERDLLERQLREAQKLESLGTLAGGVAHDFNNLLTVIRGNAELARESAVGDPDLAESVEAVLEASERATVIVRQLLAFGRPTRGPRTPVDVAALARDLLPVIRASLPATVRLDVQAGDRPATVVADPTQLQQVLLNLTTNAEHAMRATGGGTLTIAVATRPRDDGPFAAGETGLADEWVCLSVRDTGTGIPAAVRDRIFEPFFTTKPVGEGTGLGLSVLHGIVTSHGGRIDVATGDGRGTTFTVWLPATAARPAAAPAAPPAPPRGQGQRILLVDDEAAVARALTRMLVWLGYRVTPVGDPAAALAALEHDPAAADLLLTDQTMPGMTGDVLAERVRAVCPTLPIVIATGHGYRLDPERLEAIGVRAVLEKPLLAQALAEAVHGALAA